MTYAIQNCLTSLFVSGVTSPFQQRCVLLFSRMPLCNKIPLRYCADFDLDETKIASVYQAYKTNTQSAYGLKLAQVKYGLVYEIYRLYSQEDQDKVAHILLTLLHQEITNSEVQKIRQKIARFHKRVTRCPQERRIPFYEQNFFGEGSYINSNGFESGNLRLYHGI